MMKRKRAIRIDKLELKAGIVRGIGRQRADKYFDQLGKLLTLNVNKKDFSKYCYKILGKENLHLHNQLIGAILKNAHFAKGPPLKSRSFADQVNGRSGNSIQRKVLGPANGTAHVVSDPFKVFKAKDQQCAAELVSLGSRPPIEVASVEDGEEVEQKADSPSIQSKSPVIAPLGISLKVCEARKFYPNGSKGNYEQETCQNTGQLPDSVSLKKHLARRLEIEGIGISTDCVNLLNNSLDVYIKRLVEPCLEIAASRVTKYQNGDREHLSLAGDIRTVHRGNTQAPTRSVYTSMQDFYTCLEMNPPLLGGEWALKLDKISSLLWDA